MHLRKLLLVVIALVVVTFSVGLRGQGLIDGIKVTLPQPVTVGDKVLEPGEYEIRRPSSANRDILQIFNKDKMVYETNVLTVATGPDEKDPKETKVILHHIGDAYYFDKIWMEDKNYGWEFPLPSRARALQREAALNVPARVGTFESTSTTEVSQVYEGPGLRAQLDAVISQQDRDQAALAESQAARDREAAERDRQAQLDRERLEQQERDNRVAAVQPEPAPVTPSQSEARVSEPQSQSQSQPQSQGIQETPEQLPETATNWLALLIGGLALLTVSFLIRPARAEG